MSARRGVSCPFSWDDETSTGLVCGTEGLEGSEQWNCGFSYACIRRDYYFTLESLKLEQTPNGCWVTWDEPVALSVLQRWLWNGWKPAWAAGYEGMYKGEAYWIADSNSTTRTIPSSVA